MSDFEKNNPLIVREVASEEETAELASSFADVFKALTEELEEEEIETTVYDRICLNCKYYNLLLREEPCHSCVWSVDATGWEPKE